MDPKKERDWADRLDDREEQEEAPEQEPTYPDGSVRHECWAEDGYTRRDE
ncbi:MAG: hypothetical protein IKP40_03850 [Clostridia bacterium]|nr:hypothetical protein [Clostridia bacterium]